VNYLKLILKEEDDRQLHQGQQRKPKLQYNEYEFSSIFPFRIKQLHVSSSSCPPPPPASSPDFNQLTNLLITNPFQFEEGNYKPGFAKPTMLLEKSIAGIPYYDIVEEQVTEDVTNNQKPGEIITETKITQVQKMRYIIDSNIYANEGLILVCRVESLDCAQHLLDEYIRTLGFDKRNYVYSYVYGLSPAIMQQLFVCMIIGPQYKVRLPLLELAGRQLLQDILEEENMISDWMILPINRSELK
jgi:hypothetical protein